VRIETIGHATLYLADCRDVLPMLGKVDAVVTDPPYGIAEIWQGGFSDKHGWGKAKGEAVARNEWDNEPPPTALFDALRAMSKYQVFWGGNYFGLPPARGWYVWNKPERGFTLSEAELAWTNRDSVIRVFDANRSDTHRSHPTQKPVIVMEKSITNLPKGTELILDPFMGSGTTGVACVNLGRKFIGIEIEPTYFEMACDRIRAAESQGRLFA
jgi:site-specific DNA-methyltransferase (adenine-specific)